MFSIVLIQAVFWIEKWDRNSKTEFVIFHKSRYSVFGERNRTQMKIYHDLDSLKINNEKLLISYKVGEQIEMSYSNTIPLYFEINNHPILIINKSGIYKHIDIKTPVIVLQNSPKINLQRLINELNPSYIIANGSNYKSYIQKWEKTSIKTKTPFWYTGQKGAYIIR